MNSLLLAEVYLHIKHLEWMKGMDGVCDERVVEGGSCHAIVCAVQCVPVKLISGPQDNVVDQAICGISESGGWDWQGQEFSVPELRPRMVRR